MQKVKLWTLSTLGFNTKEFSKEQCHYRFTKVLLLFSVGFLATLTGPGWHSHVCSSEKDERARPCENAVILKPSCTSILPRQQKKLFSSFVVEVRMYFGSAPEFIINKTPSN